MQGSISPFGGSEAPLVSLIVCTRDRPQKALNCLRSMAESAWHSGVPAEILLVENGSQDGMRLAEAEVDAAGKGMCRMVRLQHGCLSAARNLAMGQARGRLVAFVDDDCVLALPYMADLMRHKAAMLREGTAHYLIGGRVTLGDPRDLPFTVKDDPEPQSFHTAIHPGGFVQGCNFFLPKATAEMIGPFDLRFGPGARFRAGEDTDYLIRAYGAGVSVRYVPDMPVMHFHGRRSFAEVDRLNRTYAFANGAILAKHARRHPWLLRHLGWTIRASLRERIGGPVFNSAVGLSWGSVVTAQFRGAVAFGADTLRYGRQRA